MVINDTHIEAGQQMTPKARAAFYTAIVEYTALGVEPQGLPREAAAAWTIAKKDIDNAAAKAEAGRRGGEANAKQTAKQSGEQTSSNPPSKPQATPQAEAKQPPKQNASNPTSNTASKSRQIEIEKEKEIEIEKTPPIGGVEKSRPPDLDPGPSYTLEEVRAAFRAAGFGDGNAQAPVFWEHYAAQGWVFGNGRPVVNLAAAVGKWMRDKPRWASGEGGIDGIDILE